MATTDTSNIDLARAEVLWKSGDALRGQIDAAQYKHVVLGLETCFAEGERLTASVRERLKAVSDA